MHILFVSSKNIARTISLSIGFKYKYTVTLNFFQSFYRNYVLSKLMFYL